VWTFELIEGTQACNRLAEVSKLVGKKEPRQRFIDCPPLAEWREDHTHGCVLLWQKIGKPCEDHP
jgi:hypothetical protein